MSLPARYSELLELSRQMLLHAQNQDWELLSQTEAKRSLLLDSTPAQLPALPLQEREAIAKSILQIQAYDREILDYVTPWREQTAKLLSRLTPASP